MGEPSSAASGPWLVVIDMQRIFGEPSSGWFTPRYTEAAAGVRALVPAFGDRVIFTRFLAPQTPDGAWVDYYEAWPFALEAGNAELYALMPDVGFDGHPVVDRTTFGKWGTAMADFMGESREMVLAGVSTDCCVLSTALAAADDGVRIRVAADACAGVSDDDHERALQIMSLYQPLIEITTVAGVLASASASDSAPGERAR